MTRLLALLLPLLVLACSPAPSRAPGGLTRSEPPAPNTGLLRPEAGIDPGINTNPPSASPGMTPVIPPNPRIQAR
ncbi:hypothetical protein JMJ55_07800 [Belnapia sp. T6]|uniref:Lipoprotein n=1 Tax=Belnapia mucosa TaxID=2804532 RepID=A0ABS1V0I7_9PROT|nr:hypothetical protein [Belnapia mucosa]MBL6455222.1 hypothetical protein [Belnapia mucosa]